MKHDQPNTAQPIQARRLGPLSARGMMIALHSSARVESRRIPPQKGELIRSAAKHKAIMRITAIIDAMLIRYRIMKSSAGSLAASP
jgi:hypothetical protein